MCFGIPMQIVEINEIVAECEARGARRTVNLSMVDASQLNKGDFVVVHLDYALHKISQQDAAIAWELYDQMLNAEHGIANI